MSVCTGAFVLAKTGLLSGKAATTFHTAFNHFEMRFPDIHLRRGARFVEDGNLAAAGGFLPELISRSASLSATTAVRSLRRLPITWNTKGKAG
jgi:transcriptional regulator GlxA family with amidase domain